MLRPRWLQALHCIGLELWLPLPLLGLLFWVGGGWVTEQMLSRSYDTKNQLQADMQLTGQPSKKVLSIKVAIKRHQGFSQVKVRTANSALKELEFEFPFTEFSQVEAAIAQELGLSAEHVRKLVRYHIESSGKFAQPGCHA